MQKKQEGEGKKQKRNKRILTVGGKTHICICELSLKLHMQPKNCRSLPNQRPMILEVIAYGFTM